MIRLYKKKIVNINVNIVLASLITMCISIFPVKLLSLYVGSVVVLVLSSYLIDGLIDMALFTGLHCFANDGCGLLREAVILQGHRIALAVIFFLIAVSGDYYLLAYGGLERISAYLLSYLLAIVITRTIHTIYLVRTGFLEQRS